MDPVDERIREATLTRFAAWLSETRRLSFSSYQDLWRWSVDDLSRFWGALATFCGIRWSAPPSAVLGCAEMPGAEWFPGSRVSYVEHTFRDRRDDDVALFHASELRALDTWTWRRLRAECSPRPHGHREKDSR